MAATKNTEIVYKSCPHCRHKHAADTFRGGKCADCRTEGVQAHVRRIDDALFRLYLIQARRASAIA